MAVTTDVRVPDDVVAEIAASEGFVSGRSITLTRPSAQAAAAPAGAAGRSRSSPGARGQPQHLVGQRADLARGRDDVGPTARPGRAASCGP